MSSPSPSPEGSASYLPEKRPVDERHDSFEYSPADHSAGSTSSGSNPRRSLNPAFTLSPRQDSEEESFLEQTMTAPEHILELDKLSPPDQFLCDFSTTEERRLFVTQYCADLAPKMSTRKIIDGLLPALLTVLECDDFSESFGNCAASIAAVLPTVLSHMECTTETVSYFMGLIMELCCTAEHDVVRDITIALQHILLLLSDEVVIDLFLPFVSSMRASFWVTPRTVAAGLLGVLAARPAVVKASGLSINEWFSYFIECSRDQSTLVRQAAVRALHQWIEAALVHRVHWVVMPLPLVKEFATDDLSDTVRFMLVEEIVNLAALVGPEATAKYLQQSVVEACRDPSWRVRYTAASNLGRFVSFLSHAESLIPTLSALAQDEEPEIRAATARQIDLLVEKLPSSTVEKECVSIALQLAQDEDPHVRRSAVQNFSSLVLSDNEQTVDSVCLTIVNLMQDAVFSVQISAIKSLQNVLALLKTRSKNETKGRKTTDVLSVLMEHLLSMSDAGNWRLRDCAVLTMKYFSGVLSPEEFTPFVRVIRALLRDPVSNVRNQSVESLRVSAEQYGAEWATQAALDLLKGEFKEENQKSYMWRVACVHCLRVLLPVASDLPESDPRRAVLFSSSTSLLQRYATDTVANVRFTLAQSLAKWKEYFSHGSEGIRLYNSIVTSLQSDPDPDVIAAASVVPLIAVH
ncbi:protein phosphatase 2 (formerly 2A), regulatory subunit A [Angomonas deanei]|uniref:HEAT repeat, putative n=1 Tax=Angomonas deanei TaxID=59799 RepID=A0A7G2CRR0_9TRYP|nr:protein phosphatase 2 (formerly 2A), regulatory subunit A [Angomonas deanei]CAD2221837.1 HEAT repeat, putative [Angomonas deanei]|eukprot:EPY36904.1 protein phosphatase 2 (formerly 2A), regulatory subunit A [Angomonas deanei]